MPFINYGAVFTSAFENDSDKSKITASVTDEKNNQVPDLNQWYSIDEITHDGFKNIWRKIVEIYKEIDPP